jgi:transposase
MLPTVRNIYPDEERQGKERKGKSLCRTTAQSTEDRANIIMDWFADHPEIDLIRWPSKSPDLNPIENLWGQMILNWGDPFHGARRRTGKELDATVRQVKERLQECIVCLNSKFPPPVELIWQNIYIGDSYNQSWQYNYFINMIRKH